MTLTLGYKFTADQSGVKQAAAETVQDLTRLGAAADQAGQEALEASQGVDQLAAAERDLNALMAAGTKVFQATRAPMELYAAELEHLDALLTAGAISQDTYARAALQGARIFQATRTPLELYAAELEQLDALLAAGAISQDTFARATRQAAAALNGAEGAAANMNVGLNRSTAGYRQFGAAAQQVGFQVADVATQISLGANSMQVMAIQGGQLIGAFGPWGAVIGAAVTVVGALAVGLWDAGDGADGFSSAADAAERTADALDRTLGSSIKNVDDLAEKYRSLTGELRAFEQVSILAAQRAVAEEQEAILATVETTLATFESNRALVERAAREASQRGQPLSPRGQLWMDADDALEQFKASGNVTALAVEFDRLSSSTAGVGDELRDVADALLDPARQMQEATDTAARLEAQARLLAGTATEADQALLGMGNSANRAGEDIAAATDPIADLLAEIEAATTAAGDRVFDATRTPLERYVAELERLDGLLDAGAISHDTFGRAARQAAEELARAQGTIDGTADATDRLSDLWDGAGDALGRFAGSAITDIDSVGEAVQRLGDDILKLGYQTLVLDPAREALNGIDISGIIGGFFGGGGSAAPAAGVGPGLGTIYHEGGVIGRTAAPTRAVDPAVFANVPRFHGGGLVAGERAVIAKEGEIIGWPNQLRHAFGGGRVTVQVIDQRQGDSAPVEVEEQQGPNGDTLIRIKVKQALDGMARTGELDSVMRTYGARRQGVAR